MIHWTTEAEPVRARTTTSSIFLAPTPADPTSFFRIRQNP
jgi:hypothetical protein